MPAGGKKEGESSGDETKKRPASPNTDNNDSDSLDGNRRSRRKKTKVCRYLTVCSLRGYPKIRETTDKVPKCFQNDSFLD